MKEIWKDIKGYEGLYQISDLGRIYSIARKNTKGGILKGSKRNGYKTVVLWKNGKYKTYQIHRLVAENFIVNHKNKETVNHKNGIKTDNRAENLEWATQSENIIHAWKTGLTKSFTLGKRGKLCKNSKVVLQVDKNTNKTVDKFYGTMEASRKTGICQQSINNCCNNKRRTAGGYIWKYAG